MTAVAGLLGTLAAVGWIGSDDANPEPAPTPTSVVAQPASRTDVTLLYTGDAEGCRLDLTIDLGDRTVRPTSISFVASDIELGSVNYRVQGFISCPLSGGCDVQGGGLVDTRNSSINMRWFQSGIGVCTVELV